MIPSPLRADLDISPQETAEGKVFVIRNPDSGKYYRFREKEFFLAGQFDGISDFEQIALKFEARFGEQPPIRAIEQFAAQLASIGLLQGSSPGVKIAGSETRRPLLPRLLFIKIKALNPEKFIAGTYRFIKPLYSHYAYVAYIFMVLIAAVLTIADYEELLYQGKKVLGPQAVLLIYLITIVVTFIHELSHSYACHKYGGKVNDMGLLLLYFLPCFYTDVSSSYMFADRKKRLAVTLAGIVSQIVVWALAVIIWRITEIDTFVNKVAFLIIALSFVGISFNLNPLLRLDGYYVLADLWEIPNLRRKAFTYIRQKIIGLGENEIVLEPPSRLRRKLIIYGLAAMIYSVAFFGYIFYHLGQFVHAHLGGPAVALMILLLIYLAYDGMKKGMILKALYNQRGAIMRPRRLLILGTILTAAILSLIFVKVEFRITANCLILPREQASLKITSPGSAEMLIQKANEETALKQYQLISQEFSVLSITPLLKVGDSVKAGDLIASIKSNIYEAERRERYANLERAKRQLELLERGPQIEEIRQTEDILRQTRFKAEKALIDLNRAESLFAKGMIPKDELEQKRTQSQVAKAESDFYQNQLTLLKRGARPEEIEMARAQVDQLAARISHLESQIEQTSVQSPIAGVVTQVSESTTVITIARTDTMRLRIFVSEKEIAAVTPGSAVKARMHSFPDKTYAGEVLKIDPLVIEDDRERQVVIVTAGIANEYGDLKPGMTGKAKINCGKRRLGGIILWHIFRQLRLEFWSWW